MGEAAREGRVRLRPNRGFRVILPCGVTPVNARSICRTNPIVMTPWGEAAREGRVRLRPNRGFRLILPYGVTPVNARSICQTNPIVMMPWGRQRGKVG